MFEVNHFRNEMLELMQHESEKNPLYKPYWDQLRNDYPAGDTFNDWLLYDPDEAIDRYRKRFEREEWLKKYYKNEDNACSGPLESTGELIPID